MLSAAHVLAMDAKNLLDVVDSIRTRYMLAAQRHKQQQPFQSATTCLKESYKANTSDVSQTEVSPIQNHQHSSTLTMPVSNINEEGYQIMSNEGYESSNGSFNRQLSQISSSSPIGCAGIYDNECIVNEHVKDSEIDPKKSTTNESGMSTEMGTHFSHNSLESAKPNSNEPRDESLKIVEDNTHLYCNLTRTSGTEQLVHN